MLLPCHDGPRFVESYQPQVWAPPSPFLLAKSRCLATPNPFLSETTGGIGGENIKQLKSPLRPSFSTFFPPKISSQILSPSFSIFFPKHIPTPIPPSAHPPIRNPPHLVPPLLLRQRLLRLGLDLLAVPLLRGGCLLWQLGGFQPAVAPRDPFFGQGKCAFHYRFIVISWDFMGCLNGFFLMTLTGNEDIIGMIWNWDII